MKTRVSSLLSIVAVTGAIFIKIFPFSGHLIGVALVLLLTRLQSPNGIKVWFRQPRISGLLFSGLIAAFLMLTIDYFVLSFPGLPSVDFSRFHILHNNARLTAVWIAAVWLFIAPSEELISRAFLIDQWNAVFWKGLGLDSCSGAVIDWVWLGPLL